MASQDGRVSFENILNFRDVGWYINHSTGKQLLRPGVLFRSARPDGATTSDRKRLIDEQKLKTIIDLRTPTEHIEQAQKHGANIEAAPATSPNDPQQPLRIPEIEYRDVNFNGKGYSNALIKQLSYRNVAKLFGLYALNYRKDAISVLGKNVMAARGLDGLSKDSLTNCKSEVKAVFDILCNPSSYPVMVHCTQGKDRTGLIVLLALLLCGIPQDAIAQDYKLSESELQQEREEKLNEIRSIGLPDSFADCPDNWVSNVCRFLKDDFEGVEKYLESCGVSIEQRNRLKALLKLD